MARIPKPKTIVLPVKLSARELDAFEANADWRAFVPRLKALHKDGLEISDVELYTYALYYEWDKNPLGIRSYADFRSILPRRWNEFEDYLHVDGERVKWKRAPTKHMVEILGIAGTLALSSAVLGITEADYAPIPERSHATLDYSRTVKASRRDATFEVEAKGTADGASTSDQRADIRRKKDVDARLTPKQTKKLRLGVIVDISKGSAEDTHLEAVDPPSDTEGSDPALVQQWYRLSFYLRELRAISNRAPLTLALANRLRALERLPDSAWNVLNNVPLADERMEDISVPARFGTTIDVGSWFDPEVIHGRLYPLEDEGTNGSLLYLFRGLRRRVLEVVQRQSAAELLDLSFDHGLMPLASGEDVDGTLVAFPGGLVVGIVKGPADLARTRNERSSNNAGRRRRRSRQFR